jgi:hypothetical protein
MQNYILIAPKFNAACYCDKVRPLPPPESYPTLREAAERIFTLCEEVAKQCFLPRMIAVSGTEAIRVRVRLFDEAIMDEGDPDADGPSATVEEIIEAFNTHPSVPINAEVYFWESLWEQISLQLQGLKEIEEYLQTPDLVEIRQMLAQMGATATDGTGIHIVP